MSLKKICAWCLKEIGEIDGPGPGVTHGICPECLRLMGTQSILQPEHLAAGLTIESDDHILQLMKRGQVVARFTSNASKDSILKEAYKHLDY